MTSNDSQVRHLIDEVPEADRGKQSHLLTDDDDAKVLLFAFAAGEGLAEHVAPLSAILLIISGTAGITVGDEAIEGRPGTWIRMAPRTPHSIKARTPVRLLLTLLK